MIDFEWSDGGRAVAGFQPVGWGGDCATRAAAIVLYWEGIRTQAVAHTLPDIYRYVSDMMIGLMSEAGYAETHSVDVAAVELRARTGQRFPPKGMLSVRKVEEALWKQLGFNKVRTGGEITFSEAWERHGACIVTIRGHAMALLTRRKMLDTLDWRMKEVVGKSGIEYVERTALGVWVPSQSTLC